MSWFKAKSKTLLSAGITVLAGLFLMFSVPGAEARVSSEVFGNSYQTYSGTHKKRRYTKRNKRYRKYSRKKSFKKRRKRAYLKRRTRYNRGFSIRSPYMQVVRSGISTRCFPGRLRNLIARVSKRYGRKIVVTSGYRSPSHNRRVGGAKRSQHMTCKAVDFRVPGVSTYALARFVKRLPGVGGVGTYCGKSAIHMDVGPRRNWHWGCRSKRRRVRSSRRYRLRRSLRG